MLPVFALRNCFCLDKDIFKGLNPSLGSLSLWRDLQCVEHADPGPSECQIHADQSSRFIYLRDLKPAWKGRASPNSFLVAPRNWPVSSSVGRLSSFCREKPSSPEEKEQQSEQRSCSWSPATSVPSHRLIRGGQERTTVLRIRLPAPGAWDVTGEVCHRLWRSETPN